MAADSETDGEWTRLQTGRQTRHRNGQTGKLDTSRQTDNWAEKEGVERGMQIEVGHRNPHRSTPLIGVPPLSVTLINLRESDSISF